MAYDGKSIYGYPYMSEHEANRSVEKLGRDKWRVERRTRMVEIGREYQSSKQDEPEVF